MVDGKSPRLCRKFSSPPPLAVSRTSSPVRARKLSLTSSLNSRIGALDLTTSSSSSSPTSHSPTASPPPHTGKVPLDLSTGPSAPEQSARAMGGNTGGHLGGSVQQAQMKSAKCLLQHIAMVTPHACGCLVSRYSFRKAQLICLFVCLGAVFSFLHTKNGYSAS